MAPSRRKNHSTSSRPLSSSSSATAIFLLLIIVPCWSLYHLTQSYPALTSLLVYLLVYLFIVNMSTCILYYRDKSQARIAGWRISERSLHFCELAGGWPAAFISQRVFHHKTSKAPYQGVFWLIVLVHELVSVDVIMDGALHRWIFRFLRPRNR